MTRELIDVAKIVLDVRARVRIYELIDKKSVKYTQLHISSDCVNKLGTYPIAMLYPI